MLWSADRPLTWGDFDAVAPVWAEQGNWVASPDLVMNWTASYAAKRSGSVYIAAVTSLTITCAVDSSGSWAIASRVTAGALHHEQLHFDLYEVYHRLLEMSLRPLTAQAATGQGANQALDNLLVTTGNAILARAQAAELQFDKDTANGTNLAAQATWEARIASYLENPAAAP